MYDYGCRLVQVLIYIQMTIAQIVHDNEMYFGLSEADIHSKVRVCIIST